MLLGNSPAAKELLMKTPALLRALVVPLICYCVKLIFIIDTTLPPPPSPAQLLDRANKNKKEVKGFYF